MPHVVAATARPIAPAPGSYREAPRTVELSEEPHLPELAQRLGTTVYELRARFAGGAPWMVARLADPWDADTLCQTLRRKGFGAVTVDLDELRGLAPARGPISLSASGLQLGPTELPYARIAFMVDAMNQVEHAKESVEHVIVGPRWKKMPATADIASVRYTKDRQRALYLFDDKGAAVRVPQDLTRSAKLHGVTSLARYEALRDALLQHAPQAGFDPRLVDAPRRRTSYSQSLLDRDHSTQRSDNLDETDLAAWVLHRAVLERQRT